MKDKPLYDLPYPAGLNFHGKKLIGHSFSRRNLTGADFSSCNLRGADFSRADLTGANFSLCDLRGTNFNQANLTGAIFRLANTGINVGIESTTSLHEMGNTTFLGGFLTGLVLTVFLIQLAYRVGLVLSWERILSGFILLILFQLLVTRLLQRGRLPDYIKIYAIALTIIPYTIKMLAQQEPMKIKIFILDLGLLFSVIIIPVIAIFIETIFLAVSGIGSFIGGFIFGNIVGSFIAIIAGTGLGAVTIIGVGNIPVAVSAWRISIDALRKETPELDWLRRWSLQYRTLKGTDFRNSILRHADFSGANLQHARFAGAQLENTRWKGAVNLSLANTYDTILEPKVVRELLIKGEGERSVLKKLDLKGIDFFDMELAEADFTDADLSWANLSKARLPGANLTRAVLLGTDLRGARLTRAVIAHWNIDKHTRFDDVECDYVYLDEVGHVRQPATGDFQPGEFSKLYQEIANTIDFLVENQAQMEALLNSLQTVRAKYGDEVRVCKAEEKDGALKVSVSSPPEQLETIRQELTQEFAVQRMALESRVQLLELEKHHLQREAEFKGNMLEKLLDAKLTPQIITQADTIIMADNHSITGSTFNQSAIAQGTGSSAHYSVQTSASLAELETLLAHLAEQIDAADLQEDSRETALAKVETLREAASQPQLQGQLVAAKALGALETIEKLANVADVTLKALGTLFGL